MKMTDNEIVTEYSMVTEKRKYITALSMLNGCSVDTIRQILTDNGVTDLPEELECRVKKEIEEPARGESQTDDCLPEAITGCGGDIELPKFLYYRTAGELLEAPDDMTSEEKDRLARIQAIPELVKILVHKEIDRITAEIMEREKQRDILIDYLNGESING